MIQTIKVFDDRKVSPSRLIVGNQFENGIERIQFELPENMLEKGYRYLILNKPSEDESYPIPLDKNNIFYVDSRITYYLKGVWIANVVLVKDEIKEDNLNPDTWTFISDNITLIIKSNYINNEYLGELPLPENLKIIYDDLLKMYETIKSDYENGNFNGRDGKSAYELAVENGFKGTEDEWLASLDYEHSEEFEQLAEQVKNDAKKSASNASTASAAAQSAATNAGAALNSANVASQSAADASDCATQAQQTAQEAENSKTSAETASSNAQQSAQSAEENANKAQEIADSLDPTLFAIKETATGNPTIISDSADWRLQKLNIYGQSEQDSTTGKNLLNPTGATKVGWNIELPNFKLEVGKQYTYTAPILEGSNACGLFVKASNTQLVYYIQSRKTQTFTVPEEADFSQGILLGGGSKDALTLGDELTAMVELGSVATEFEPYTGEKPSPSPDYPQEIKNAEISKITICNENLLPLDIDTRINNDGIYFYQNLGFTLKKGIRYVLSVKSIVTGLYAVPFGETLPDTSPFKVYDGDTVEFTPTETGKYYFHAYNKDGITDEQKILWLNIGEKKPYTEHVSEKITLSEPITLRGIPVDSGGNVTVDGQQYVSDVICEKDGVIGVLKANDEIIVDGTDLKFSADKNNEYWSLPFRSAPNLLGNPIINLSNYFPKDFFGTNETYSFIFIYVFKIGDYFSDINEINEWIVQKKLEGNPLKIQYLVNPTFEPLPEEVQAQYKALKSYYSNTVIQTGCWNEVTYVADTKTWIENKLSGVTELALGIGGK